jgi:uncharacterized protein
MLTWASCPLCLSSVLPTRQDNPMTSCNRFYRFCEFGREVVYDIDGANAFFVNDTESRLLDCIQDGGSVTECTAALKTEVPDEEIEKAVEHVTKEGLLDSPSIPYQDLPRVYTLALNVTQRCNLRCKYCYVENPGSQPTMDEETARKAVDFITEVEDIDGFGISFYGGEPLLNFPVIKSTIEYATQVGEERGFPEVKYHVTTNGTLLTDEMVDFFCTHDIDVMVSIDGPADVHDAMRVTPEGEGTHEKVSHALQKLVSAKGKHKISVSGVITNMGRLKDVYTYFSQFPLRDIKLSYVRYLDETREKDYALSAAQKHQYMEDMRDISLQCFDLLMKGVRPPYYNFENKILQLWKHSKKNYFCPAGLRRFGISPGGEIYPCGPAADLGEFQLGTIDGGLDPEKVEAWVKHSSFQNRKECEPCWARNLCIGGCPLQWLRDLDEERCKISRYSTELAIALYAAVKEKNELMLASFVDEDFLSKIRNALQDIR